MKRYLINIIVFAVSSLFAQPTLNIDAQKFAQLKQELPTPNSYRTASGHKYWQQQVDYKMNIVLDDEYNVYLALKQ